MLGVSTLPPEPVDVPAALAEPVLNPPARWVAFLTLASIGLWAGFFGPIQVLLAQQAEAIDPVAKKEILPVVLGLGALTSVVCNPLFGAFSDRTTLRMGRRLPWVMGGAVGGALSLAVLSVADHVVVMDGGRVAATGSHPDLMDRSSHYRDLVRSQQWLNTSEERVPA